MVSSTYDSNFIETEGIRIFTGVLPPFTPPYRNQDQDKSPY